MKDRVDLLQQVLSREGERKKLAKYLRGVTINITYKNAVGRKRYKIGGLSSKSANATSVDVDGKKVTIEKACIF